MNYDESVAWLSGLKRYGIKLGLDRFGELLRRTGDPHLAFKSAHIAGTNGKGSVTSMIAEAAQSSGLKTGRYLSPYVFDLRERIQIDGQMISREDFARLARRVSGVVDDVESTEYGQATEFEVKTLIAFLYFAEESVDFASVEVGLGGRLDATNVLKPEVAVITSISYDHMDRLGETLGLIAAEKAGIIKPETPVVNGTAEPEASEVIERVALQQQAPLTSVLPWSARSSVFQNDHTVYYHSDLDDETFDLVSGNWELSRLSPKLKGAFQSANAACAAGALLSLRERGFAFTDEDIRRGVEKAWLPGRLQVLSDNPLVIADGAHNPASAEALAQYLEKHLKGRPLTLVVGMTKPHNPSEFLGILLPLVDTLILTQPPVENAWRADELAASVGSFEGAVTVVKEAEQAVRLACESVATGSDGGVVCITGSFYLLGAIPEGCLHSIGV